MDGWIFFPSSTGKGESTVDGTKKDKKVGTKEGMMRTAYHRLDERWDGRYGAGLIEETVGKGCWYMEGGKEGPGRKRERKAA